MFRPERPSTEFRQLMRAQTIEGYAARHSKLAKSVTFNRDTLQSPPNSANLIAANQNLFPLIPFPMPGNNGVDHEEKERVEKELDKCGIQIISTAANKFFKGKNIRFILASPIWVWLLSLSLSSYLLATPNWAWLGLTILDSRDSES